MEQLKLEIFRVGNMNLARSVSGELVGWSDQDQARRLRWSWKHGR
jgi:hypothetical protein